MDGEKGNTGRANKVNCGAQAAKASTLQTVSVVSGGGAWGDERGRLDQFFKIATECLIKKLDFTLQKRTIVTEPTDDRSPVLEKKNPRAIKKADWGKGNGNAKLATGS